MSKLRCGLFFVPVLAAVILAGCGGGDGGNDKITPSATLYLSPTSLAATLPPTWTPRPTLTRVPALPTLPAAGAATATPAPATGAPPTPSNALPPRLITVERINEALAAELATGTGVTFEQPPRVNLDAGVFSATANIYTTPGDPNSARAVVIEAQIAVAAGQLTITRLNAYYLADSSPYDSALVSALLTTAEQRLNLLVAEEYGLRAGQVAISNITVSAAGITIKSAERR